MPSSLPALRAPQTPASPVPGDAFQDRVIWLIGALTQSDALLTYTDYQSAQRALSDIFGEQALDARTQAKLLYALMHPHPQPAALARETAKLAETRMVSASLIETVLRTLEDVCAERAYDEEAQALYQEIVWSFRKTHLEQAEAHESWSMRLGRDVTDGLAHLYHASKRLLIPAPRLPGLLAPEAAQFNAHAGTYVNALERLAATLNDASFLEEVRAFRRFMVDQPYRIVVAGERKRGKSSIVNALIGRALSPVQETLPETATVIEFRHADAPDYTVQFLDTAQFAHLEAYLEDEAGNTLLRKKIETLREGVESGVFEPGKLLAGITSWDDLPDYVAAGGRYSGFVAKVSVSLPLASLRDGVVIVDTPGLNDTDAFHDYLAFEESLAADGVLFVMDARNPGAGTELNLLRKLARSGRTVGIIGVLTHVDKLDEGAASLDRAREQAWAVLREACRQTPQVHIYGVAALNAREAMRLRTGDKAGEPSGEFGYLLRLVQDMLSRDASRNEYRLKRSANFTNLIEQARKGLAAYRELVRSRLPDPHLMAMLERHADQLEAATKASLDQAGRIVSLASDDLDAWQRESEERLQTFKETLTLRLMDAVHQEMDAATFGFARPTLWKRFENDQARHIARQSVDEFLERERTSLAAWEDKLHVFAKDLQSLSTDALKQTALKTEELNASGMGGSVSAHFLVQSHKHMSALAAFSSGAAVGAATAMTPMLFLLTAGNVLSIAASSPAMMAAVAVVAGAAGLVHKFGNPAKRKADFAQKKREEAEAYAERICAVLRQELGTVRADIGNAYDMELRRSFMPALESLYYQSVHIRRFLEVMRKIESDVGAYDELAHKQLTALEQLVR